MKKLATKNTKGTEKNNRLMACGEPLSTAIAFVFFVPFVAILFSFSF
jgi:hypothetical protein